ncbi:disulfide formation protein C [Bhargavaea beijingensis]|uniref:Disulfide bond formation protein B n=1 Tax=Bhargavaea beijingensis TaxID=426756 RepID=A0ABX9ZBM0_9BACL|nr:disulfide oxidoreductase [Bhargavaea beijingensis]MCW1927423.1 disulfide oxidoreductase [Bhargavaea beijingensis]RSK30064.1 disulfide bond formation protein B [Bhargavaea beijingensis]
MEKRLENMLLAVWTVSLVATAGSLYFSEVRGYIPCELCWYQRILMYPMVVIGAVAIFRKDFRVAVYTLALSVIGGLISLYHYGIQKLPALQDSAPSCGQVSCTGAYINWMGFVTIPFLALTAFIIIAVLSLLMLKRQKETN